MNSGFEWLNYHHLLYFWMVAKEGSVAKASKVLRLAQPTVSGQVRSLEEYLGMKLFERVGRNLQLTDDGHVIFGYADEIFGLGRELMNTVAGRPSGRPLKLKIGISDVLPKLVCHRLISPALEMESPVQIVCHGDKTDRLLASLAVQGLDLVLSDMPVGGNVKVKAFNHLLGECGVTFFGTPALAARYKSGFPASLNEAPLLVPTEDNLVRRSLEQWFESLDIQPRIVAEFDDSGVLKTFGEGGAGVFCAPTIVEKEVEQHYSVQAIGRCEEVVERFYAITVERRIKNPAVMAIADSAKQNLFSE